MIPGPPQPGDIPRVPPMPEPSEIPEAPSAYWFMVKQDLEALKEHVSDLTKRLEGLEGKVSALEQVLRKD